MSLFITFEGIDGSGKSTQVELLRQSLLRQGKRVVVTREPGGTRLGEKIRNMLLHEEQPVTAWAELLLYAASRAQLTEQVIRPAIQQGAIVLCDRFTDSSLAYQGFGLDMPVDAIKQINHWATGGLQPNLTLLLDLTPEQALRRNPDKKRDRIEQRMIEFHRRVREGYLSLAAEYTGRIVVVNADRPREDIARDIESLVAGINISSQTGRSPKP